MVVALRRVSAEVVSTIRPEGSDLISARVRLRFSITDLSETVKRGLDQTDAVASIVTVNLKDQKDSPWRHTKRQIVASAWHWLEDYFDGARFRADDGNLFSDVFVDRHRKNRFGLTHKQELSLQSELREIEMEFAEKHG